MRLFGSIKELVSAVFRINSKEVTLQPNQEAGFSYSQDRTVSLPKQDADAVLVSRNSADILTSKTIDADSNTLSNIANTQIKANAGIVDTKLATISTAGKVSGSAIISGTIGGTTSVNTSGSITTTASLSADDITLNGGDIFLGVGTTDATVFNTAATITIGTATGDNAYSLGSGATANTKTKTLNLGTGGLAGSTTNINIGSTAGNGTVTINENTTLAKLNSAGVVHTSVSGVLSTSLVTNSDIASNAVIDFSKLATLTSGNILVGSAGGVPTSVSVTGDVTITNAGVTAIGASKVTNSMLAGSIDFSKLANLTSGNILVGNVSNVPTSVAVTGDVTISNAGVTTIGASKVTNSMLAGSIDLTSKVTGVLPLANGGTASGTANGALNNLLPSQGSNGGKVLQTDGANTSWVAAATANTQPPIGSIVAYNPGYYTDGSNGGFTVTGPATNTVAGVNTYLPSNWRVCDGTALNDPGSPIWTGAGRYLPNLTDSRFLMGFTSAGTIGGNNSSSHTHSVTSNVTVGNHTLTTANLPSHTHAIDHDHAAVTSGAGSAHAHRIPTNQNGGSGLVAQHATNGNATIGASSLDTFTESAHTHSVNLAAFTGTSGAAGSGTAVTHTVTNNAVTSGAPSVTENRPLYLTTFYIVRVA